MSTGSDEPTHGVEYPPLPVSPASADPYAPVDYPSDGRSAAELWPSARHATAGLPTAGVPTAGLPTGLPTPRHATAELPATRRLPTTELPAAVCGRLRLRVRPLRQPQPVGTNGKAIAALVTSVGGLFACGVPSIIGLILGIIAMRETKRTGQEGHGMALAGVIVGVLAIVGWILYAIVIFFLIFATSHAHLPPDY